MMWMCVKDSKTVDKENIIASNYLRMNNSKWICADIHFLGSISDCYMNHYLKWFQGFDPNIGTHGFLCYHCPVNYYLQLRDVEEMERTWQFSPKFRAYRRVYNELPDSIKEKKIYNKTNSLIL